MKALFFRGENRVCFTWLLGSILLFLLIGITTTGAAGLDHWHWRNPLPSGNSLKSVAFGNGVFVAAGDGGAIQTSADGVSWNPLDPIATNNLHRVIYANGLFVCVGDNGLILTSPNGATWTVQASGSSNSLVAVTYGNSIYVASGDAGTVVTSANGVQWSAGNAGVTNRLGWITFGKGVFIVPMPPPAEFMPAQVLVSTDALHWSPENVTAGGFSQIKIMKITFGNGRFLAYDVYLGSGPGSTQAYIYTSTDGTNWVQGPALPLQPSCNSLAFVNNQFFETDRHPTQINISADGQTWTAIGFSQDYFLNDIAHGTSNYVLVGDMGLIMTSPEGTNWTTVSTGAQNRFVSLAAGQGTVVAVGSALPDPLGFITPIVVSTNGLSFEPTNAGTQSLTSVAFGVSNFVTVGLGGALQRSTDAKATVWSVRPSGTSSDLSSVCFGNGLWVAVGKSGAIITSPNTLTWALRTSGTSQNLFGVAYGNGLYVAVGIQGTVLTSPEGINWTPQFADTLAALNRVAYGNGQFVAVGTSGAVVTSTDGSTWVTQSSGATAPLFDVAYGAGQFVAVGAPFPLGYVDVNNNVILHSYDGATWLAVSPPTDWDIEAVSFNSGTFWLSGGNGTIIQSDPIAAQPWLSGRMLPNTNSFELTVNYVAGNSFRIQVSTNEDATWADAITVTNCPPVQIWTDTNAAVSASRFYRVVSP